MTPAHIGLIMDGNGRWAQSRGLKRSEGYTFGLLALRRVLERLSALGVEAVTAYAFSAENFARPKEEIAAIFSVVRDFNGAYDGNLRIRYMGDIDALPDEIAASVIRVEERTAANDGIILNIALNYGGRRDILHAASVCYTHGDFSPEKFESSLGSAGLPPLDLIVRSGGEKRLSGFMLYEAAYAELIFCDKLWPDVTADDAEAFVAEFQSRKRKFGA